MRHVNLLVHGATYYGIFLLLISAGQLLQANARSVKILSVADPICQDKVWKNAYDKPITYYLVDNEHMKNYLHGDKHEFRTLVINAFEYWEDASDFRFLEVK